MYILLYPVTRRIAETALMTYTNIKMVVRIVHTCQCWQIQKVRVIKERSCQNYDKIWALGRLINIDLHGTIHLSLCLSVFLSDKTTDMVKQLKNNQSIRKSTMLINWFMFHLKYGFSSLFTYLRLNLESLVNMLSYPSFIKCCLQSISTRWIEESWLH